MTPTTSPRHRDDSHCYFVLRVGVEALAEELAVYRVYGGDVFVVGYSWTIVDPRTVADCRTLAGLPFWLSKWFSQHG